MLEGGESEGTDPLECKTEELVFPVDWLLAQEEPLGWTNASLPANVDRCSEFQFLQCMAILYGRTLLPSGSIRNMWKKKATGFLQPMDVGGRFGLVRDRFEGWRKYLKLWPANAPEADPYARVAYLIAAFNENRKKKVSPGTGVCIDESTGKWIPFFKDTPEGIPNLTKLIRKPVGVGAEYKCMADAWSGINIKGVQKIHNLPTDPHVKVRWQLNDVTGSSERITRTVPRTSAIKEYFQAACIIDVHNHLRQGGLEMEDAVATNDWWFRVFCTISGMCEVDAFKCFCLENNLVTPQNHCTFVEKLTVQLLTNNRLELQRKQQSRYSCENVTEKQC